MGVLSEFRKKRKEKQNSISAEEQKEREVNPFSVSEQPLSLDEKVDKILVENRALRKELLTNRVIDAVILIIVLLYINYKITNLQDIVGVLVQVFMGGIE